MLLRVPIQGGSFSTLLELNSGVIQDVDPIATSTAVILHHITGTGTEQEIVSVPKAGGSPTTLATTNGSLLAFTANDTGVYFVDQGGVQSVPVTGGSAKVLSERISGVTGLAVAGSSLS